MHWGKKQRNRLFVLGLCLSIGSFQLIEKARASNFNVNPIKILLSSKVFSQIVTVKNGDNEPLRFQVSSYSWSQDAKGEMQLSETQDIVAFPTLFALKPGDQRVMRVGTLTPVGSIEKTYRIFLEELPSPKKPNQTQSQIRLVTKLGIPIFIQPNQPVVDGRVEKMVVSKGELSFQVKNTGNVHFIAQQVRVQGIGEAEKPVFDLSRNGWYVLAGASQPYDVKIPQNSCSQTKVLVIEVKTEEKTLKERLEMPKGACSN